MGTAFSSLGTELKVAISAVLTTIAGIRDVDWKPGEVELMEVDDILDDYVEQDATGRIQSGEVTAQMFTDFASAAWAKLAGLWTTPAKEDFQIEWQQDSDSGTAGLQPTTQPFKGILKQLPVKAERGQPLLSDISIAVVEKPTLATAA